ncbi:MAG: deoxyribodipyrimidine photo-lyase [Betaproteobacteria bacterium]|nr:deoxyribodipyrimidine photo-lyase [Betaproteobacteria bacterium]
MNAKPLDSALVWLRRDLRCDDHAALHHALSCARRVWCAFVYDTDILDALPRRDQRVAFIHAALAEVDATLRTWAQACAVPDADRVGLIVRHGRAVQEVPALAAALGVNRVVASHDDEPQALARDGQVLQALARQRIEWVSVKDHVVFERREVMTQTGGSYGVFTPYKNAWLKRLAQHPQALESHETRPLAGALAPLPQAMQGPLPSMGDIGFEAMTPDEIRMPTGMSGAQQLLRDFVGRMDDYRRARDFPAIKGPSYLSAHLRFGTVSVRQLARQAWDRAQAGSEGAEGWLSELVWRDFYHQILHHHPRVVERAFKPEYDRIAWATGPQAEAHFQAWCEGRTGYPLVDAAMHQINQTGWMHNRLRMVVSSFLIKDLGIDWRRGEAYFAEKLIDFDLAANNGGWQWAASSGCDAQPYFRIFNPLSQSEKFDPKGQFIRRYLPVLKALPDAAIHAPWLARPVDLAAAGVQLGRDYPLPIVQHDVARQSTLERYAVVKSKG